tara:strand:- start:4081 stop:4344 length:264 start_codon:yes stop_codon:yes gene_type:complete
MTDTHTAKEMNLVFDLPIELQRKVFDYGKKLAHEEMINELKKSQTHFNSYVEYLPSYYEDYVATAFNHFSYNYNRFMKELDNANGWR